MDNDIEEKIRLLKIYLDKTDDPNKINKLFDIYKENNIVPNKVEMVKEQPKEQPKKVLDKNSYKYVMFLKVLNKILVANEMNPINDIYDFKNMTRDHIIKDKEANNLFGWDKEIFKKGEGFDKAKCQWYLRKKNDNYIISFLKGACGEMELTFDCQYKRKVIKSRIINFVVYSIK